MGIADLFRLDGRVALVTGSSRGIGRAIALALAEYGANVAINYVGSQSEAEEVKTRALDFGVEAITVQASLGEVGASRKLYQTVVEQLGAPDILVLNASVQVRKNWLEIIPEEFDLQIGVNLRAAMELLQLAVPTMKEKRWGRVLTVGSVQQVKPHPEMLVYAASKSAQLSMVRNLAKQLAHHEITFNNLAPGVIDTDRNAQALSDPAYRQQVLSWIPAARAGQPLDCAGAALLLCSEAGRYITGVDLLVDGGMHL